MPINKDISKIEEKMIELSIIVPCYNEEKNINLLTSRLQSVIKDIDVDGEIVLVNDGSIDGTGDEILKCTKKHKNVVFVDHSRNKGIAEAWKSGLAVSRGKYISILDADMQYSPEDVKNLYNVCKMKDCDIAQGTRAMHHNKRGLRCVASRCFGWFLNYIFGYYFRDIKSGFLVCKRSVFAAILETDNDYTFFQHFIGISAVSQGFKLSEVPVFFSKREMGESFIKSPFFFSLKSMIDMPKAFIEFRLNRRKLRKQREAYVRYCRNLG